MENCIFCKIIAGQAAGKLLYHDDQISAFRDIHPAAPIHILVVPNRHIASLNDLQPEDAALMGRLFLVAAQLARQEGIERSGYRLIVNTGPDAGQAVFHVHLHLMGGHRMRHPVA